MKKQLLLSAVALFSVVGVSAQLATITQEWKTPVGDATNMRQGTYANGKFYIQNKNDGTVDVWTKDGKESTEEFYKLKYCSTVVYMVPRA